METQLCVIESGAISHIEKYINEVGVTGKRCAVYDENTCAIENVKALRSDQQIVLPAPGLHADEFSTAEVLARLEPDVELLIAVGGGVIHDIVRYCSKQRDIKFISVPTAASCDGFAVQVAAMTFGGFKTTISNCHAPLLVVADVDILRNAPAPLVLSGIGDIFGKFVALADWQIAHAVTDEKVCPVIFDMMNDAVHNVWNNCLKAQEGVIEALSSVMYGLLLSGFAMQMMGNSRPASGGEHHISHLIEVEPEKLAIHSTASHGEKVGVGTVLVSKEYHQLAEIEDITPFMTPYEPVSNEYFLDFFGERLYSNLVDENKKDCLAAVTPQAYINAWPKIRRIIAQIPSADEIYEKLSLLGAKRSLTDLEIEEEKLDLILENSPLIRNRLTLMRMRRMLNIQEIKKSLKCNQKRGDNKL